MSQDTFEECLDKYERLIITRQGFYHHNELLRRCIVTRCMIKEESDNNEIIMGKINRNHRWIMKYHKFINQKKAELMSKCKEN